MVMDETMKKVVESKIRSLEIKDANSGNHLVQAVNSDYNLRMSCFLLVSRVERSIRVNIILNPLKYYSNPHLQAKRPRLQ